MIVGRATFTMLLSRVDRNTPVATTPNTQYFWKLNFINVDTEIVKDYCLKFWFTAVDSSESQLHSDGLVVLGPKTPV